MTSRVAWMIIVYATLGVGAVLGRAGNYAIGRGVIASARKVFGDAPEDWNSTSSGRAIS